METITCPYCECKVRMSDVDAEGGACPECGAMITGSLLFDNVADLEDMDELEEGESRDQYEEDLDDID